MSNEKFDMKLSAETHGVEDESVMREVLLIPREAESFLPLNSLKGGRRATLEFSPKFAPLDPPIDPLYVYPNSRLIVSTSKPLAAANLALKAIGNVMPHDATVQVDSGRSRVSIKSHGGLEIKVKFYNWGSGKMLLAIRKDFGAWPDFTAAYVRLYHKLLEEGLTVNAPAEHAGLLDRADFCFQSPVAAR